jgi:hypothetical protein
MKAAFQTLLLAAIISFASLAARAQTYNFTTIAGSPGSVLSIDGTNGAARFDHPYGVAVDAGGSVYVAENDTVRKITPVGTNWVATTIAGVPGSHGSTDGTNTTTRFWGPYGVAVDNGGNVYVADSGNCIIRQLTPVGTNWVATTIAGLAVTPGSADGTNSAARFQTPTAIAVDANGNLFVADTGNPTNIRKITHAGTNWIITTISPSGRLSCASGVAVDGSGNVFVADTSNYAVRKLTQAGPSWILSTIAGALSQPGTADGTNSDARFWQFYNLAADGSGRLYIADTFNDTIRKITPAGTNWVVTTIGGLPHYASTADGKGSVARFSQPYGIAVGNRGEIYLSDDNSTLRLGVRCPPVIQTMTEIGGTVSLTWTATALEAFQVQYTTNVAQTNWSNLGTNITATDSTATASDPVVPGQQRFYRVQGL